MGKRENRAGTLEKRSTEPAGALGPRLEARGAHELTPSAKRGKGLCAPRRLGGRKSGRENFEKKGRMARTSARKRNKNNVGGGKF